MIRKASSSQGETPGPNPVAAITSAWLLAGTLDITAAIVNYLFSYKGNLLILFQFIASGLLGRKAFAGGTGTAILGLVFHYFIALTWTIVFFFLYPKVRIASRSRIITGFVYGIFVWIIMNLVVLPLSGVPHLPFHPVRTALGILYIMFCIGLPVSFIIGRYYSRRPAYTE